MQGCLHALRATFVLDAADSALGRRAAAAADALQAVTIGVVPGASGFRVRTIAAAALIGRDVRECDRLVAWGHAALTAAPHLRELLAQCRSKIIAFVPDAAAAGDAAALLLLRRHAAHVLVDDASAVPALRTALLVPVHAARGSDAPALAAALAAVLQLAPGSADSVEAHLVEARQWAARGDWPGAFASASRALRLAPDQSGIVADVARLLANLGDTARAEQLCERFLRQRPAAAPVQQALAELRAALPS